MLPRASLPEATLICDPLDRTQQRDKPEAYAILAKTMSEGSLKQIAAAIAAKRTSLMPEEAKELAVRAFRFKKERGRLPSLTSQDAWERRMAEGAAAFVRYKDEGRYE